ncbi:ankyrin repeat-containing protein [Tanacetum coccineum]
MLCLEGPALAWFRWTDTRTPFRDWEALKIQLLHHFQPSQEGSLYEQFLNISQEGSAQEYVALFEKMAAQLVGIQEEILEGMFIKGLKLELRIAVRTQQPKRVTEAIQLTLLIDETRSGGEWGKSSNSRLGSRTGGEVPRPTASHAGDPNSKLVAGAAGEPPFKRMSEAKFANKNAKGLCFRCDGKFTPGHKCLEKSVQVMVIYDEETNEEEEEHEPAQLEGVRGYDARVSFFPP